MITFYDFRNTDHENPHKYPLQGYIILKTKKKMLIWIRCDGDPLFNHSLHGFFVVPPSIYLYEIYIAKNFWNALKYFIKKL